MLVIIVLYFVCSCDALTLWWMITRTLTTILPTATIFWTPANRQLMWKFVSLIYFYFLNNVFAMTHLFSWVRNFVKSVDVFFHLYCLQFLMKNDRQRICMLCKKLTNYGLETWPVRIEHGVRLDGNEMSMRSDGRVDPHWVKERKIQISENNCACNQSLWWVTT